jgi:hypothetical protein
MDTGLDPVKLYKGDDLPLIVCLKCSQEAVKVDQSQQHLCWRCLGLEGGWMKLNETELEEVNRMRALRRDKKK